MATKSYYSMVCPATFCPDSPQEKDVTSLWMCVGFAQKFTQRFTQTLFSTAEEVEIVRYCFNNGLWLKLLTKQKNVIWIM